MSEKVIVNESHLTFNSVFPKELKDKYYNVISSIMKDGDSNSYFVFHVENDDDCDIIFRAVFEYSPRNMHQFKQVHFNDEQEELDFFDSLETDCYTVSHLDGGIFGDSIEAFSRFDAHLNAYGIRVNGYLPNSQVEYPLSTLYIRKNQVV